MPVYYTWVCVCGIVVKYSCTHYVVPYSCSCIQHDFVCLVSLHFRCVFAVSTLVGQGLSCKSSTVNAPTLLNKDCHLQCFFQGKLHCFHLTLKTSPSFLMLPFLIVVRISFRQCLYQGRVLNHHCVVVHICLKFKSWVTKLLKMESCC